MCVVDRYREIFPKPRAIVLDWEVMRALQYCGVAYAIGPTTRPHPGTDFIGIDGQVIKRFDPAPPPYALGWPATSTFIQPELERMLRHRLNQRENVSVRLGTNAADFTEGADLVRLTLADDAGMTEEVTAKFLVGCDGSNSRIRAALGFELEDFGFDEWWVVVDAWQLCDTDLPPKTTQYCWPSRPATYVVGPGNLRRWEMKLLPGERPEEFEDPARLRLEMSRFVDVSAFEIWRSAAYRFAARVGDRWRSGRVFLAGDAVHQMPPFMGQGMCAGIRDAFNLAWKLVHASRHGLTDLLLDSYELERKPHVSTVIGHTKEFGQIVGEMDEHRARQRDITLRADLLSGRMKTTRQAFIPDLASGLLGDDELAGSLMIQPEIEAPGPRRLMDDFVPMHFLFISDGIQPQSWMKAHEDTWKQLHGVSIAFADPATSQDLGCLLLNERGATFADWAKGHQIRGVIVRPDRYIYGAVRNSDDLDRHITRLDHQLSA